MAVKGSKRVPAVLLASVAMTGVALALFELGLDQILGIDGEDWSWVAPILGAGFGWLGRERWVGWLGAGSVGLLLLVQWWGWPATLARGFIRTDPLPAQPVDAIVVLSASITDEARLNHAALDRLLEGIRLVQEGVSSRLVVSSVVTDVDGVMMSAEQDQRALIGLGARKPELEILSPVGTTRTEALRMDELASRRGWASIVLVTSPTHTKRACAAFEAVGLTVTCHPSPDRSVAWTQLDSPGDRTAAVGEWAYETLGWWEYRARGWILPTRAP